MQNLVKPLSMLLLLAALFTLACQVLPQWAVLTDVQALQQWFTQQREGVGLFSALLILAVMVGAPRQVISFVCGVSFGSVYGTLLALAVTLIACAVNYWGARWILPQPWISRCLARLPDHVRCLVCSLRQHTFTRVLGLRLLPLGNNVMTNLIAGFTRTPFTPFWLASALGYIPQTIIFAIAGAGIMLSQYLQLGISIVCLVLLSLVVTRCGSRFIKYRF